jgi:hypothetical protein
LSKKYFRMDLIMNRCSCSLIRIQSAFRTFAVAIRISAIAMLLLMLPHRASADAAATKTQAASRQCAFSDTEFDPGTDVHALDRYRDAIAQLLKQEKFGDLDCVADAARTGKTRFPGGAWKLRNLYIGLEEPRPGHATQEDWLQHLDLLERWTHRNPQSITAPVALAEAYASYAWDARGDGSSDTVSGSGWKLFGERIAKAKTILDEASALSSKCPDWYVAMLQVAQGQSWELPRETALFQQAVAFEPAYQYYYRFHATLLLPKWSGEEGYAARFAEQSADRVGGEAGDALYFLIAEVIVCACEDAEFSHFSWPRVQKGFAALEKKYGSSLISVNSFALMAANSSDWVAADSAFKRIGDNWDKDAWRTLAWFKQNKESAAQVAPIIIRIRASRKEALANMETREGQAYLKTVEQKLTTFEQPCLKDSNGDQTKFEMELSVGEKGNAELAQSEQRQNAFAVCVMRSLYQSFLKKETPFPPPPHASYWLLLELDPATFAASAK